MLTTTNSPRGDWLLRAGQVMSHPVRQDETLKVRSGRLWLTTNGELNAPSEDLVLEAGQCLLLPAGQRVVVEALNDSHFDWAVERSA